MFKVNNKNTKMASFTSFWCFYCYLSICFNPFSSVSVVAFEQVNTSWVCKFVTFWQIVSKILVRKVLSWLLWSSFTLYLYCELPTDIHLLKAIPIISKQKSSGICSDVIKIIWTIEVLTDIEASCLCFALFGGYFTFQVPGFLLEYY